MRIPLLDHGYIELVETWGSDERIIEAARMSTGKGFLGWEPGVCPICDGMQTDIPCYGCEGKGNIPGDAKLLRRLWVLKHATPFEMAGCTLEVQAPLFVFREWHRHRTQSYAERSARYTPLPDFNYVPTVERLLRNSKTNKQAGTVAGAGQLTAEQAADWLRQLEELYAHAESVYQVGLQLGVPKELARLPVPVARYSTMRASTDLRNWLGFLTLRMDGAAQEEIRVYANAVHDVLAQHFPRTLALFDEGRGS